MSDADETYWRRVIRGFLTQGSVVAAISAALGSESWKTGGSDPPPATTGVAGIIRIATNAIAQEGTNTSRAVTPAGLASVTASATRRGLIEIATQAEVDAGTDSSRAVTPATLEGRLTDFFQ